MADSAASTTDFTKYFLLREGPDVKAKYRLEKTTLGLKEMINELPELLSRLKSAVSSVLAMQKAREPQAAAEAARTAISSGAKASVATRKRVT